MHIATATNIKRAIKSARRANRDHALGVCEQMTRYSALNGRRHSLPEQRARLAREIVAVRACKPQLCDFMRCRTIGYPMIDGAWVIITRM